MTNSRATRGLSCSICVQVLVYLALISAGHRFATAQHENQQLLVGLLSDNRGQKELDPSRTSGEKVDSFSNAIGDQLRPNQLEQLEWLLQQAPGSNLRLQARSLSDSLSADYNQYHKKITGSPRSLADGYYLQVGLDGPNGANSRSNYNALIDEFKQYSSLANPLRESRAFKPKLMSTARGFGKRSYLNVEANRPQRIAYSDLLAVANPNGASLNNGKMSGEALSSKYAEWISQVLSRWPSLHKYVNDKYHDYNGDGIITMDEKYQSL